MIGILAPLPAQLPAEIGAVAIRQADIEQQGVEPRIGTFQLRFRLAEAAGFSRIELTILHELLDQRGP